MNLGNLGTVPELNHRVLKNPAKCPLPTCRSFPLSGTEGRSSSGSASRWIPNLKSLEIIPASLREQGPALLFERPRGHRIPLVMNLFGTMDRVRAALGANPLKSARELIEGFQRVNPPSLRGFWESRSLIKRALLTHPSTVRSAPCQEIVEAPDLSNCRF